MKIDKVINYLKNYKRPVKIMDVCGTHTSSIAKNGIKDLISESIRLVSGPGCPVCVTLSSYIDVLIDCGRKEKSCVLSFGDMFKVRGNTESLAEAKAAGLNVELMYSPLDVVEISKMNPKMNYIIAAVGFETTAPIYAVLMEKLLKDDIHNVKLLTSLKTMIPALKYICENEEIDGFIAPGHVSVIIGSDAYEGLCSEYKKPFVVSGFEPEYILCAIYEIVHQIEEGVAQVNNMYKSVVTREGNKRAMDGIYKYFESYDATWRGLGKLEDSGLVLKKVYEEFDIGSRDIVIDKETPGCRCGDVILGRITPEMCQMFGKACTPENPIGACMVSSEGACGIYYENKFKSW
ncbi:MAG: hydrogenase formation protein HypD [Oscillospiraceae bacterium]|nr:hydrogenase formation protein HypD [Oscillospiraceae bacterium]